MQIDNNGFGKNGILLSFLFGPSYGLCPLYLVICVEFLFQLIIFLTICIGIYNLGLHQKHLNQVYVVFYMIQKFVFAGQCGYDVEKVLREQS